MARSKACTLDLFTKPLWQQGEGMDTAKTSPAAAGGSLCGAGVHLVAVDVCETPSRGAAHAPGVRAKWRLADLFDLPC
jgi:hypothetical protein